MLILKELANSSSTLMYSYVPQIFDLIWIPLRDPKVSVREGAAQGLHACLKLVQIRENQMRRQLFKKLFDEAQKGLRPSSSPDVIHGSLLALREIAIHTIKPSAQDGRYKDFCEIIMKFRDHRDPLVRKTVIGMTPTLAELDPDQFFRENYLASSMSYLVAQLKKDKERAVGMSSTWYS